MQSRAVCLRASNCWSLAHNSPAVSAACKPLICGAGGWLRVKSLSPAVRAHTQPPRPFFLQRSATRIVQLLPSETSSSFVRPALPALASLTLILPLSLSLLFFFITFQYLIGNYVGWNEALSPPPPPPPSPLPPASPLHTHPPPSLGNCVSTLPHCEPTRKIINQTLSFRASEGRLQI